jgi:hypothetical protein
MLALVIGLRLREIAFGVLHEIGRGLLAAETVGLALDRRIDRAIEITTRTRSANICLDVRFGRGVAVSFCLTKAALSSTTIADSETP